MASRDEKSILLADIRELCEGIEDKAADLQLNVVTVNENVLDDKAFSELANNIFTSLEHIYIRLDYWLRKTGDSQGLGLPTRPTTDVHPKPWR